MPDTNSPNDMEAYLRLLHGEGTLDQQRKDKEQQEHEKRERELAAQQAIKCAEEEMLATLREIIAAMVPIEPGEVRPVKGAAIRMEQPYAICKYPVTQCWYEALMGSSRTCLKGDPQRPVECVSWFDAQSYCKSLNDLCKQAGLHHGRKFALPTVVQWEYACRAGSTGNFGQLSSGEEGTVDQMGWYSANSGQTPHPVGQKDANAWGLYDMHGNVTEWCQELHEVAGTKRLIRGGAWDCPSDMCSAGYHDYQHQGSSGGTHGFRIISVPA